MVIVPSPFQGWERTTESCGRREPIGSGFSAGKRRNGAGFAWNIGRLQWASVGAAFRKVSCGQGSCYRNANREHRSRTPTGASLAAALASRPGTGPSLRSGLGSLIHSLSHLSRPAAPPPNRQMIVVVNSIDELRRALSGLDDEMNVAAAPGLRLPARTVRELRGLMIIPCKLRLSWPPDPQYPESTVEIERAEPLDQA